MTRGKLWFCTGMISLMMATMFLGLSMRRGYFVWIPPGEHNFTQSENVTHFASQIASVLQGLLPNRTYSDAPYAKDDWEQKQSTEYHYSPKAEPLQDHERHSLSLNVHSGFQPSYFSHDTPKPIPHVIPIGSIEHEYTYPDWWESAWPRSATASLKNFVGDKPLFPPCTEGPGIIKGYPFQEPMKTLPNSKNPCWYQNPAEKKGLRCAPYFYLAGVAKGGTSDLYRRIRMHPDVMRGSEKEYHWWDRGRYEQSSKDLDPGQTSLHGGESFDEYIDRVTERGLDELEEDLRTTGQTNKIFGDGSPSYMWDSFYWVVLDGNQGCMEPRIITGQHIRHFNPKAKIILTFRHPTTRLYSRFLSRIPRTSYLRRATSEDFHRYVVQAIHLYRMCYETFSIRHCAYNHSLYSEATVRLVEGMYPVFMADWLRIWHREQMLILRYEDYGENLETVLQNVFDFLGLARLNRTEMDEVTHRDVVNVGDMYEKVGQMLPQTKEILDNFYSPFVHKFAELLNDKRFLWADKYV